MNFDNYLSRVCSRIFNDGLIARDNTITICGSRIGFFTTYHFSDLQRAINKTRGKYGKIYIIVFDGEPMDISLVKGIDLLCTTKLEKVPKNIPTIYIPVYAWMFVDTGKNPNILIKQGEYEPPEKTSFCCFAYSNCHEKYEGVRGRKDFYFKMQDMTKNRVDNLGYCYNDKPQGNWTTNDETFIPYKFVIAFENVPILGYITEKLINPMLCGAIPIYLGAPDVADHFNTKSFINVRDFDTFEDCINYVIKVDQDEELYKSIIQEPWCKDNKLPEVIDMCMGTELHSNIKALVNPRIGSLVSPVATLNIPVHFVTFTENRKTRLNRIISEAKASRYFNVIHPSFSTDLDIDFVRRHGEFIRKYPLKNGYCIWKPQILLQIANRARDGDILIWCDHGMRIQQGNHEKILGYYSEALKHDILGFGIYYEAKAWTKKDILIHIAKDKGLDPNKYNNGHHHTSSVLIMRKSGRTISLLEDWKKYCEIYHLIDDSPSVSPNDPSFKENRHDQSILSILLEIYGAKISNDNFSDSCTNYMLENGTPRPFVPARLR